MNHIEFWAFWLWLGGAWLPSGKIGFWKRVLWPSFMIERIARWSWGLK